MKAIVCTGPGGPEVMTWAEVAEPVPAPGEVVIHVAAAGVNRADLLQRAGHYPPPPGASDILGLECAGVITALGAAVRGWSIGDRVCALLAGGGYAERAAVPAGQVMPIPAGLDLAAAAGLPEVAATVVSNLSMVAKLRAGEWVLIHGGGSGIGTFAIQYAVALGARVAVTAGGAEKLRVCAELGAEVLINYREQDFATVIADATDRRGVDVILDIIGAKYLENNLRALAPQGRLVVIGLQGGVKAELNLGRLLSQSASIHATSLRGRPPAQKAAICDQLVTEVWPLIDQGRIKLVVDSHWDMTAVASAHEHVATSAHVGKVILTNPTFVA